MRARKRWRKGREIWNCASFLSGLRTLQHHTGFFFAAEKEKDGTRRGEGGCRGG